MLPKFFNSKGYPTHRGCYHRAGRRLRYLLSLNHRFLQMLQALSLLQRLPLMQEVIHNSSSYIV